MEWLGCCMEAEDPDKGHRDDTFRDEYKWGSQVGAGGFAKVYSVKRKNDDKIMACKVIM